MQKFRTLAAVFLVKKQQPRRKERKIMSSTMATLALAHALRSDQFTWFTLIDPPPELLLVNKALLPCKTDCIKTSTTQVVEEAQWRLTVHTLSLEQSYICTPMHRQTGSSRYWEAGPLKIHNSITVRVVHTFYNLCKLVHISTCLVEV